MKWLLVFLLCGSILQAQSVLEQKVNCTIEAPNIAAALRQLSKCTAVDIAFSASFFKVDEPQSLALVSQNLSTALTRLMQQQGVSFKLVDGRIVLYRKAEKRYILSGYIEEADSGERLVSATVFCAQLGIGTLTNEYGFFSVQLPVGAHTLSCSYLGFEEKEWPVSLQENTHQTIQLATANYLDAVIVTPDSLENPYFFSEENGFYKLSPQLIKLTPSLAGESDPVRTAQLLPGIQSVSDGLGGIQVRGSDNGHNGMLLDGVPVYIPYHLLGMLSVFNANAVKSAQLLTGGFSARYGGSLSSVFDVRIREGNRYQWSGMGSVNLTNAQLLVEGPLVKEKASILLAGRFNHSGGLFSPTLSRALLINEENGVENGYLDYNLKFNYELSDRDRFYLSYYRGGDAIELQDSLLNEDFFLSKEVELSWGNQIAALRWNHLFSKKLFANLSYTYSLSDFEFTSLLSNNILIEDEDDQLFFYNVGSSNKDHGLRLDLDYLPDNRHRLRLGSGVLARTFSPSLAVFTEDSEEIDEEFDDIDDFDDFLNSEETRATEFYLYGEDQYTLREGLQLNIGLRGSAFLTEGTTYAKLEPRLTLDHQLNAQLSWRASLSRMVQYLHLVSSSSLQFPTDLWLPSGEDLAPQSSWLSELYLRWQPTENTNLSLGAYHKSLNELHILPPFVSTTSISPTGIQEILLSGSGSSRGLELFVDHHQEKNGFIGSYVLSATDREYEETNLEESFPFDYDSRHQLKLFYYRKFGKHFRLSANWVYSSANPQRFLEASPFGNAQGVDVFYEAGERNSLRSEPYHRLDIEASFELKTRGLKHELRAGGYNIYQRENIAFYQLPNDAVNPVGVPVSVLPFLPSLSYSLKF